MAENVIETPQKILRNKYLENVQKQTHLINLPASPLMKQLGYGTCVNVYKYDRKSASPWAIKKVIRSFRTKAVFQERIDYEAEVIRKLLHPNIIGFRSYELDLHGNKTLALECMTTSLDAILEKRLDSNMSSLPSIKIIKMIENIASALAYLHFDAHLLHGDMKSHNILVRNDFEICKICDFGVSLPLDENLEIDFRKNRKIHYSGTPIWSAPEIMNDDDVICAKADMFSFGLVIFETLALTPPHLVPLDDDDEEHDDDDIEGLNESIACGTRPPLPESFQFTNDYNNIIELFYHCTAELAEDRPSSKDLFKIITDIKINRKHFNVIDKENIDENTKMKVSNEELANPDKK